MQDVYRTETIMKMSVTCNPRDNHILYALKKTEFKLLEPHLELTALSRAEVLFEAYDKLQYVYFPVTATTSLLCCLEDGVSVEVAMVGNEGILGVSAFMGRNEGLLQAIVNIPGYCYRVSLNSLHDVLARSGGRRSGILQKLILRYAQTLFLKMSQAIACNRRHTLEQQLSYWLLVNFDRSCSENLSITHESIAYILGVRRESISETAKKLQDAGVIEYSRGNITLKDRVKLEMTACECYNVTKEEAHNLITDLQAA